MAKRESVNKPNQPRRSSWQTLFALSIMGEMVQIDVKGFSGPVDLLLELIDQEKLDITALSLAEVTDQYWRELETEEMEPDALAEFINVGSRLLFIKSCALLPSAKPPADDLEELDEVAGELTAMLEEHKRFKEAVDLFRQLEEEGRRTFARMTPAKGAVPLPPGLEGVTLDTLLSAVKEALADKPAEAEAETVIHIEPVTVNEKIEEISQALGRSRGRLGFRPLLKECKTRTEIVVLFLAVLELIKGGGLWAEQETAFGEIELIETAAEATAG